MIELKRCENCNEKCLENSLKKAYGYLMCPNCRDQARDIAEYESMRFSRHNDDDAFYILGEK